MLAQTASALELPGSALAQPAFEGTSSRAAAAVSDAVHPLSSTPSATEPYKLCRPATKKSAECYLVADPKPVKTSSGYALPKNGPTLKSGPLLEGSGREGGWDPKDLQEAYKIPTSGGEGQTVAIVDAYGDPWAESDLATYRKEYGLEPCEKAGGCFTKVNEKGETANYPPASSEWGAETSLDVDMVSAACPHCHILLVEATSAAGVNLAASVEEAVKLKATEISNSYGGPESGCEGEECVAILAAFNHPGIPITASAGDNGYIDYGLGGKNSPNIPATSPNVIAVGGTELRKAANSRGWSEKVWQHSGGGCSLAQAKPTWQTDPSCSRRMDNDVATVANDLSIYSTPYFGGWSIVGGTSASAPLVAGIEGHASKAVREEGPEAFYRHGLYDVTEGTNGPFTCEAYLCRGVEGYDGPTGWGTPDGPLELTAGFHVAALEPTAVTTTGATLQGYINPEGRETTYYFEYGETTTYGLKAPASSGKAGSGVTWKEVSQTLTGLAANTTYHYRLVANNGLEVLDGKDQTLTTSAWSLQATPNPSGATESQLDAVSCPASTACTAVGDYKNSSGTLVTLAEHWNGTGWSIQATPNPRGATESHLDGVSCPSSTACTAVGDYKNSSGTLVTLAEHWNGTEWSIQSSPNPAGASESHFEGVSCTSSTFCMAVGGFRLGTDRYVTLAERWNGTEWVLQSTPETTFDRSFDAVSCGSSTTCTAVGYGGSSERSRLILAESWSGGEWSVQSIPDPSGTIESFLNGVSCTSSTSCTAVGEYEVTWLERSLMAEHLSGGEWSIQSTPSPSGFSYLSGVSCFTSSQCIAVGGIIGLPNRLYGERWNGTEWGLQQTPGPEEPTFEPFRISGVSCTPPPSTICIGVGLAQTSVPVTLAESYLPIPGAVTEPATNVTASRVTLNGTVNPEGQETKYRIEYGETTTYGKTAYVNEANAGSGTANIKVSQNITNLHTGTTYHFRLAATSAGNTAYGQDMTFTTRSEPEWRLVGVALTESVATGWKGKMKVTDSEAPIVGTATVECEEAAEGRVTPGSAGEVTKWTTSGCVGVKGCEASEASVEAVNLPWRAELVTAEGTAHELLVADGHGTPGYKVKCRVLGGLHTEDVCTGTLGATTANAAGGVTATFKPSEKLSCTASKSNSGSLEGAQTIAATKGGKLSAVTAAEAATISETEWKLGGTALTESVATGWKGKMKVTDSEAPIAGTATVECEEAAEGPVTPGGAGEVTKWTASGCVGVKGCEASEASVEAVNLPWREELVTIEGTVRDVLVADGHGPPGFKMKCKILGLHTEDVLTGVLGTTATNVTGGVTAAFNVGEKLLSSASGKASGSLEGSQTLQATLGGTLEVT
ncbi:MAG TPA: hypothetical protein VG053_07415 [Solirubrobacteraceae bacterium]|nr:hypothetical protein [Solirubrobacteraceae bacterium]